MSRRKTPDNAEEVAARAEREEVQRGYETVREALRHTTARADAVLERLKRRVPRRTRHLRLVTR